MIAGKGLCWRYSTAGCSGSHACTQATVLFYVHWLPSVCASQQQMVPAAAEIHLLPPAAFPVIL